MKREKNGFDLKSEMPLDASMTAAGLQIDLEGNAGFDFPRSEFCRVRNVAGIMCRQTSAQVACAADITLLGMVDAAQNAVFGATRGF